jgi:hypothetical protein
MGWFVRSAVGAAFVFFSVPTLMKRYGAILVSVLLGLLGTALAVWSLVVSLSGP